MSTERITQAPVQLLWIKSSYSGSDGGDCVEVATTPTTVHVRDSKNLAGPILRFSPQEWAAFVTCARNRASEHDI